MLFDKCIVFTDSHFGEKQNSRLHNEDCIEYIEWMIDVARQRGITTCIFMGDWHHSRRAINVETLHFSVKGLQLINDYFDIIYFLEGNHDLFYRESRDISSVSLASNYKNIRVISDIEVFKDTDGSVAFVPWLVGDEWKKLKNKKYKYVFGHFELPTFLLNAMIRKPDTGELNKEALSQCGLVFSGHFHKRQQQNNVHYIGNCFPHNFNDVDDKERGCMVLEWNKEPEYVDWDNAPTFRRWQLQDLKDDPSAIIQNDKKIYAEIFYDSSFSFAEASHIRESLYETFDFRTISLMKVKDSSSDEGEEIVAETVQSVDAIVIEQLRTIESPSYDIDLLISEYESLDSYNDK